MPLRSIPLNFPPMPDTAKAPAPFAAGTAALVPASRQMGDFDATAAGAFPARSAATMRSLQMALKRAKIKPIQRARCAALVVFRAVVLAKIADRDHFGRLREHPD